MTQRGGFPPKIVLNPHTKPDELSLLLRSCSSYFLTAAIFSGAINLLIIGMYVGKYKALVEELRDSAEESRKSLIVVREDVARIKGRINGHNWRLET